IFIFDGCEFLVLAALQPRAGIELFPVAPNPQSAAAGLQMVALRVALVSELTLAAWLRNNQCCRHYSTNHFPFPKPIPRINQVNRITQFIGCIGYVQAQNPNPWGRNWWLRWRTRGMLDPDYSKSPAVRAAMASIAALTVAQPALSLTSALEPGRREGETSAAAVAQDIMKALAEAPKAQVRTI